MKNLPRIIEGRDRQRGAVAMLVCFMWTALFGMAVLAVDFGYLYTKRRGTQAVTDSAIRAAMPLYASSPSGAAARAVDVASRNGYTNGGTTTVQPDTSVANQLKLTVTRTYPTFFGSLFGLNSKAVSGVTIGRYIPGVGGAALQAQSMTGCGSTWGVGFGVQGDQVLTINGDVVSNGQMSWGWMRLSSYFPLGASRVNGTVKTPCAPITPGPMNPSTFPITTETSAGFPYPDPLLGSLATLQTQCTVGAVTSGAVIAPNWGPLDVANNCQPIVTNIYCSNALINIAPPLAPSICPSTATFVTTNRITINAVGNIAISPDPGAFNGITAYAGAADANCGAQAINLGAAGFYNLNGRFYAPAGCINVGGGGGGFGPGGFTLNGSIVASHINMGMSNAPGSGPWLFNGPGGGGGGTWSILQ